MLSYPYRLTKKKDFDQVKEREKLVHSVSFAFLYLAKNEENPSRFGFVISTKISKKAVERNRAKRILREAVRHQIKNAHPGFDGIFLAKHLILTRTSEQIVAEVKQ